jgi:hypothetical protein
MLADMGRNARSASRQLANASSGVKNQTLIALASCSTGAAPISRRPTIPMSRTPGAPA